MTGFSAWDAIVSGQNFGWYLGLAAALLWLAFPVLRRGLKEALNQSTGIPAAEPDLVSRRVFARMEMQEARIAARTALLPLKQHPEWREGKGGEALQVALVLQALSALGRPLPQPCATLRELKVALAAAGFEPVSGHQAQGLVNHRKWAVAFSDAAAGVVVPGEVAGHTPYGNNNPWVLWPGEEGLLELQAVMAFGAQTMPDYLAVKD